MAAQAKQLENLVEQFISSEQLIARGDLVLAAVSGGPDSIAMAAILQALSGTEGFTLALAHFDHMLRDDSAEDAVLVERFAERFALPCYLGREDVAAVARETNDTIEEAARKARYRFLQATARSAGAARIATGHTSDDQVETVLMRILHGTGIRGLAGIPAKRGAVIRPILHLSRDDTAGYCNDRGLPSVADPTNRDTRFMRNRIRHTLLPMLKSSFHPGVEINLLSLSRNAQALVESIRSKTNPVIRRSLRPLSGSVWLLDISPLEPLDATSLFMLFSDIFADHLGRDMDFTQSHYEMLIDLCRGAGKSGKRVSLPGVEVKREYDTLLFTTVPAREREEEPAGVDLSSLKILKKGVKVPGTTTASGVTVVAEIVRAGVAAPAPLTSSATTAFFSLDNITPPLSIRTPVPGDRIRPFGMSGTRKLSDIFIDKKIPGRKRAHALVLADAREILWVVGVVTSERYRVTEATKNILKLTVLRK